MRFASGGKVPPPRVDDSVPVVLSPGMVLCERCGLVMEGGTEEDRAAWFVGHRCRANLEEPCGVCGEACGPFMCWEPRDAH